MWMAYAQWEDDNNRLKAMEVIFGKTLLQINYVGLWSMYLKYVRRRNPLHTDVDGRAYKIISDAFDLALKNIGIDKDSGEIWKEYINFLKSGPGVVGGNSWQDTQKMDALRVAYKRAVCIPTSALESLWKEYGGFETGLNKINVSASVSSFGHHILTITVGSQISSGADKSLHGCTKRLCTVAEHHT